MAELAADLTEVLVGALVQTQDALHLPVLEPRDKVTLVAQLTGTGLMATVLAEAAVLEVM